MSFELLTRDNFPLSRVNNEADGLSSCHSSASNFTNELQERVARYVRASLASNTRTAYQADLRHFMQWGGRIPAYPELVAAYLADHAETLSVATLSRRMAALSKAHRVKGAPNPVQSELVRMTMRGIKRTHGVAQRQVKALLQAELFQALDAMGNTLRGARDKALLLIGFAGGFRRSELVSLNVDDVERAPEGVIITIRKSKTDQAMAGRKIGIPFGQGKRCPVTVLNEWLTRANIQKGAIFYPIDRHGNIGANRLTGEAVSVILRERISAVGLNPEGYSGHSLRAGFVTSAVQNCVSTWKIRQRTGHASEAMLNRYIRDGELFR